MRLEVGPGYSESGDGYRFRPRYHPNHDVIYLDIHPPKGFRCGAEWIVADAHRLPLRSDSMDEIFAGHVIEHLENPLLFLRECGRVLRRGGRVTIVTPNFLSRNAYRDPDHKHVFNFLKLWSLVKVAGLEPHFPAPNVGSLLPRGLRLLIKVVLLTLCDTLEIIGVKT